MTMTAMTADSFRAALVNRMSASLEVDTAPVAADLRECACAVRANGWDPSGTSCGRGLPEIGFSMTTWSVLDGMSSRQQAAEAAFKAFAAESLGVSVLELEERSTSEDAVDLFEAAARWVEASDGLAVYRRKVHEALVNEIDKVTVDVVEAPRG